MRLGIDLGGTKTELAALDESGAVCLRRRVPTPAHDYAEILATIATLVRDAEHALGEIGTVGVATPGSISSHTGRLRNSNTACLNGMPLAEDLGAALGREVRIANDANCFALSEATDGAAADAELVFGVIAGTGCGGGIVFGRRVLNGSHGIAGEWGHNPLPWPQPDELPGPPCYCGKHGCIETFLSGPAIARDHAAHGGSERDAPAIVVAAAAGDALALATIIDVLDPEVVVIGGGVGKITSLYTELPRRLPTWVFSDHVRTRIVPPVHGDSSGVRGAAWLW
ncbi:MAG: ROK family protein [Deltaproteobacteria bacterium]|nr:ROK family protein [Nannocystaceae bacterium]